MTPSPLQISCIIPAYNEEKSIAKTLQVVLPLLGTDLYEIILINDASTDQTPQILEKFAHYEALKVLHNQHNLGKSKSVAKAIQHANGNYIFLLDADLLNLETGDIRNLIAPIQNGLCDWTMTFMKNSRPFWGFKKIDYCSGQRVLPISLLQGHLEEMSTLPSYGLEVFLNKLAIQAQCSLQVVQWPGVENDFHQNREGFFSGRKRNLKIWRDISQVAGGIWAEYQMNKDLERLLVQEG